MLNKLINMAKNEMFDIAFLLADKHNLYNELFNSLRKNHNITFDRLKELVEVKENYYDIDCLDVCYNLTYLNCCFDKIKVLDISENINLTYLICTDNKIKVLNLYNNVNLIYLYCHNNLIPHLDISKNVNLEGLYCFSNQITHLDTSNNVNLTKLDCSGNLINELDLIKNTSLIYLWCNKNPNLKQVILNKKVEGKIEIYKDYHTEIEYVE